MMLGYLVKWESVLKPPRQGGKSIYVELGYLVKWESVLKPQRLRYDIQW